MKFGWIWHLVLDLDQHGILMDMEFGFGFGFGFGAKWMEFGWAWLERI